MPISKEDFNNATARIGVKAEVLDFLKNNSEYAYTRKEIAKLTSWSEPAIYKVIPELVKENKIFGKEINGKTYFIICKDSK